jgi:hypothetical protein
MGIRVHKVLGYAGYHPDCHALSKQLYHHDQENEVMTLIDLAVQAHVNETP